MSYPQSGLYFGEFSLKHWKICLDADTSLCLHKLWSADALTLSSCWGGKAPLYVPKPWTHRTAHQGRSWRLFSLSVHLQIILAVWSIKRHRKKWKNALCNILKLKVNCSSCFLLANQHSNDEDEQHNPYIYRGWKPANGDRIIKKKPSQ